jgi:hypothetical protein
VSDAEDIEAINDFMHRDVPKTAAAKAALNEWVRWYEATKPGAFSFWSDADFDHARNLRNQYNRANAVTQHEKDLAEEVIQHGMSAEQMRGETDRRDAGGNIVEQPPGVTHAPWFWPAVAAGGTAVLLLIGPKVASIYLGRKL